MTLRLVVRAEFRVLSLYLSLSLSLSLSVEEGRSTFGGGRNLGQILKELLNVSEVATNHWVFLRCDWLPVSN